MKIAAVYFICLVSAVCLESSVYGFTSCSKAALDVRGQLPPSNRGMGPFPLAKPGHSKDLPIRLTLIPDLTKYELDATLQVVFVLKNIGRTPISFPIMTREVIQASGTGKLLTLFLTRKDANGTMTPTLSVNILSSNDENNQTSCSLSPGQEIRILSGGHAPLQRGKAKITAHVELLRISAKLNESIKGEPQTVDVSSSEIGTATSDAVSVVFIPPPHEH
jgi:hypothetical protein